MNGWRVAGKHRIVAIVGYPIIGTTNAMDGTYAKAIGAVADQLRLATINFSKRI